MYLIKMSHVHQLYFKKGRDQWESRGEAVKSPNWGEKRKVIHKQTKKILTLLQYFMNILFPGKRIQQDNSTKATEG
jgi:hypothetical protein